MPNLSDFLPPPPWEGPPIPDDLFKSFWGETLGIRKKISQAPYVPEGKLVRRRGETKEEFLRRKNEEEVKVYYSDLGEVVDTYLDVAFERSPSVQRLTRALEILYSYGALTRSEKSKAIRGGKVEMVLLLDEAMGGLHEGGGIDWEKWSEKVDDLFGIESAIYEIMQELSTP